MFTSSNPIKVTLDTVINEPHVGDSLDGEERVVARGLVIPDVHPYQRWISLVLGLIKIELIETICYVRFFV